MLSIDDFTDVLIKAGDSLPLIGGQAVAWWGKRFAEQAAVSTPITSRDIDFWAERAQVEQFARILNATPKFPSQYEMTVLSGVIPLVIHGQPTTIEFLHTVPGLDVGHVDTATVLQEFARTRIRVLDPVSLLAIKLHALRNFLQDQRQDLFHLKVCLAVAKPFVEEALSASAKLGLWYVERLIQLATHPNNIRVSQTHHVDLLVSVPIEVIRTQLASHTISERDKARLHNFLHERWPRVLR